MLGLERLIFFFYSWEICMRIVSLILFFIVWVIEDVIFCCLGKSSVLRFIKEIYFEYGLFIELSWFRWKILIKGNKYLVVIGKWLKVVLFYIFGVLFFYLWNEKYIYLVEDCF